MNTSPEAYVSGLAGALQSLSVEKVERLTQVLWEARRHRKHVFLMGNGGSAATASHMVIDLSKATILEGVPRLRVVSLADNVPSLTAWANDTDYEHVFAQQLENLAVQGDLLIAISASGRSKNVLRAVESANEKGLTTVGLTGKDGGSLKDLVGLCITVDSDVVGQIEDVHHAIGHMLAEALSRE